MKKFWLAMTFVSGCASTELSDAGRQVRLMKADPPTACTEIGGVEGEYSGLVDKEKSKNVMRNHAAERGANYVRWDTVTGNGTVTGTAFKCPG